jgi:uncharacterized membrane protein YeaQ/YmgE (transglycosylase-associated protein family)
MNVFAWIVFGLIAGGIAKFIMPGKDPGGCLLTIIIGIVGALIGGVLGTRVFGIGPVTGFNLQSLGLAILGAVLLLLVFRLVIARRPDR